MTMVLNDMECGIYLRHYVMNDAQNLLSMYLDSKEHHAPFEPIRGDHFYTLEEQKKRITARQAEADTDQAYYFGVFEKDTHQLVGQVSLSNIARGVAQYADLGYFTHVNSMGRGYMSGAVRLVIQFAFHSLGLHRVQASILTHNEASRRVLEKNGFLPEGVARGYLQIAGQWQDHQIYAILNDKYNS
ncbi:TPA: GNAT family N-acetyltransferase [Enterococcus faecium]|nr:GNAT family N-acetyltransferase [Neobacillus mesonae]HDT7699232.1 GNAT family N-acetyltransferase [Enterococcus faecium]